MKRRFVPVTRQQQAEGIIIPASGVSRAVARLLLTGLCLETAFAVPYRSVYLAVSNARLAWVAGLLVVGLTFLAYAFRRPVLTFCARWSDWQPARGWFAAWLGLGILLRIAWASVLHTRPSGDGLIYYRIAETLSREHRYGGGGFPPGLPLFEAPFLAVFGGHAWVTTLCTLLLFVGFFLVLKNLAQRLGGERVAAPACAMVAIWPNNVAMSGTNAKEALLALLVTASFLLYVMSREARGMARTGWLVGAGLLTGCAALTQPAYLLFPAVILVAELLGQRRWTRVLGRTTVFSLAMLLTILPWSYRNYRHYRRFVLITTNGGNVFYRANNPKANAQYIPQGAEALPKDDFAASETGYRLGKLWIRQHPGDFAALMVRKQVVYLGDDSDCVYESMKRDRQPSALVYAGCKMVCNLLWLGVFVFLFAVSPSWFRAVPWRPIYAVCVLPLLYQWCIDSVFEAGARHHGPYLGLIAILVASAFTSGARSGIADADSTRAGREPAGLASA